MHRYSFNAADKTAIDCRMDRNINKLQIEALTVEKIHRNAEYDHTAAAAFYRHSINFGSLPRSWCIINSANKL
eukprot:scaffold3449_cov89-Skeletonema_dohrnii-CCMP3373.AAC.2